MNQIRQTVIGKRQLRPDLRLIADQIPDGARVLDVGCGDGALLDYLVHEKKVDGRGVELSQAGVNACVGQGLSVIQGDANTDLDDYPDASFDFVILSQTIQATRAPRHVLEQLLRVGRRALVSFPNFGHWHARSHLLFRGAMPVTPELPEPWYATPNIHFCTIKDFVALCRELDIEIVGAWVLSTGGRTKPMRSIKLANLLDQQGLFLLKKD